MAAISYDPSWTMLAARKAYFDANGFGDDGGYSSKWVDFKLGPLPMPFPNSPARVRAVKFHDLHHVLTGYQTDIIGEFEISAWELATGCADMYAAWYLNLGGMAAGLMTAPRRTWRAWVRGRHSRNLYREPFESLLTAPVGELRQRMGLGAEAAQPPGTAGDLLTMLAYALGGLLLHLPSLAIVAVLLPVMLVAWVVQKLR